MAERRRPVFTENFSTNLSAIGDFLGSEGKGAFDALWRRLLHQTVPTLCRLPRSGRPFLTRSIGSRETLQLAERLRRKLRPGEELRELVLDDYVILYLVHRSEVLFLAIRHHRQLSFDLTRFWS